MMMAASSIVGRHGNLDASGWRALRSKEALVVVATRPLRTWPPWRGEALGRARKVVEGSLVLDGLPREELDLIVSTKVASDTVPSLVKPSPTTRKTTRPSPSV